MLEALAAVATGSSARPLYVAKPNLLQVFIANASFTPSPESKEKLFEAMEAFVDDYLKPDFQLG
ncbi:MAG: hypothetical protein M3N82_09325 [Pseudomonadota bacterium]|nr:hypothetical protein [Pseudomonadota bacterium]